MTRLTPKQQDVLTEAYLSGRLAVDRLKAGARRTAQSLVSRGLLSTYVRGSPGSLDWSYLVTQAGRRKAQQLLGAVL